jgi:UrcA family protein
MPLSNRVIALGVSYCLLAGALPAYASHPIVDASGSDGIPRRRVSYTGLDLDTAAGADRMLRLLRSAAEQVCEPLQGRELPRRRRWQECYAQALADGVRQINHPQVTVAYRAFVSTTMLPPPPHPDSAR